MSISPPPGIAPDPWRGPGQGLGEDFTDSGQSVLELLNRVGADGWELADPQEHQERGNGPSYWDPNSTVTIYTFKNKNLVPGLASEATASSRPP